MQYIISVNNPIASVYSTPDNVSYGHCRCCLEEGNHRDITKVYVDNGKKEVYADIFLDCFNIFLSPKTGLSTLICSECVTQLRDANRFKVLVMNTEKQLLEALDAGRSDMNNSHKDIKEEFKTTTSIKVELEIASDDEWTGDCPADQKVNHENMSLPKNDLVEGEAELVARFASLKYLPKRAAIKDICPNFVEHLETLKDKKITGKSLEKFLQQRSVRKASKTTSGNIDTLDNLEAPTKKKRIRKTKYRVQKGELDIDNVKNPYTFERLTHATNITTLLEFSNVTAFKSKFQQAYPCFYCENLFEDFEKLKKHQKLDHAKDNVNKCVLQKYRVGKSDGLVVYVDISDLRCTICDEDIPSLNDLKKHLTGIHQKKMYLDLSDRVIPFKVQENNFQCQICGNLYETFGTIERHMNTHYRNYICEECDSGFITKQRLRIHGYLMHSRKSKQYPCEVCQKQFTSQQKKKIHVETVHENVKKYKCNRCPERFNQYVGRHKHMVLVHGVVAPIEYKCNVCDKSFEQRYGLSKHMRTHIQQRNI